MTIWDYNVSNFSVHFGTVILYFYIVAFNKITLLHSLLVEIYILKTLSKLMEGDVYFDGWFTFGCRMLMILAWPYVLTFLEHCWRVQNSIRYFWNALMIVRDFQRQKCGSFATSQNLKIEVITLEYVGT